MCIKPMEGPWVLLKQMDLELVNPVEDQLAVQKPMGFDSSKVGGRPIGTTKLEEYGVGLSGGVYGVQICFFKIIRNSQMNRILALKLSVLKIACCINVHLKLCSREHESTTCYWALLFLWSNFYGITVTPTILALLHLVE